MVPDTCMDLRATVIKWVHRVEQNCMGQSTKYIRITIHGNPTRALIDSGSKVCIVRQQILPIHHKREMQLGFELRQIFDSLGYVGI